MWRQRAKELGMPAVAMTDHGNLYGAISFYKACRAAGVKPIMGCEIYLAPESIEKREEIPGRKRACHMTLLAENNVGWVNLTEACLERVTLRECGMENHGWIVRFCASTRKGSSACPGVFRARLTSGSCKTKRIRLGKQRKSYSIFTGRKTSTLRFTITGWSSRLRSGISLGKFCRENGSEVGRSQ